MSFNIENLLLIMIEERKRTKHDEGYFNLNFILINIKIHFKICLDDDFVVIPKVDNQWSIIFDTYFLSQHTRLPPISTSKTSDDDLIFYITRQTTNNVRYSSVNET